ncbi:60S ribosomal L5-like [Olea europaea subsp. europaea]|uniref:60S ribosomal L5-like n=1 Tax=Olea europaea subsp. europaea TaxID=158383 RepID=A0A8S0U1F4_OLEEU|nr:60S ribosomal L5-like [Olea europaea subsp. europaea]
MEDEPKKYQLHFSENIKKELEADGLEEMYKKVHAAICADPTAKKSEKRPPKEHKKNRQYSLKKLTYEERKAKLIERLNASNAAAGADDDGDDD